jgi:hypothetical protein
MAEPFTRPAQRLPIDVAVRTAAVDAALALLNSLSGRSADQAYKDLLVASKALHMELAAAMFDARLPARPVRAGGENLTGKVDSAEPVA